MKNITSRTEIQLDSLGINLFTHIFKPIAMDKNSIQLQGGKGIGLLELQKYAKQFDYLIPEFFVLSEVGNKEELAEIAIYFDGDNVIVRSNSVKENSEVGFDGIYKSVVVRDCNLERLKKACKEVADSLFSKDAIAYRKREGITEDTMRIIVQKFIGHKEVTDNEELQYIVIETSINAQGDISVVSDGRHDFINSGKKYDEVVIGKNGEVLTSTNIFKAHRDDHLLKKLRTIAIGLQKVFGPVSLEGVYIENKQTHSVKVFLFQRRLLPKEFYQAQPEVVPSRYKDDDILFRSRSYRGAGKIENLPIIIMPTIDSISGWENELRRKVSQLKSDVILFVSTMHLGVMSRKILNDYSALAGVRAIISLEKIDFSSHAFKVASFARIPFVSVKNFSRVKTLSTGSLFFTENEAVFCLDQKREEFRLDLVQKSKAESLVTLAKKKGVIVTFSEAEQSLGFEFDLNNFSFDAFEASFHRLLEDTSGEVWLLGNDRVGQLGFKCENSRGQTVVFSGWANYMKKEGHMNLENFREHFENNKIGWDLILKVVSELSG